MASPGGCQDLNLPPPYVTVSNFFQYTPSLPPSVSPGKSRQIFSLTIDIKQ